MFLVPLREANRALLTMSFYLSHLSDVITPFTSWNFLFTGCYVAARCLGSLHRTPYFSTSSYLINCFVFLKIAIVVSVHMLPLVYWYIYKLCSQIRFDILVNLLNFESRWNVKTRFWKEAIHGLFWRYYRSMRLEWLTRMMNIFSQDIQQMPNTNPESYSYVNRLVPPR
jgi:hypothetical protein